MCCLLEVGTLLSFTRQTPKIHPFVVHGEGATLYDKFLPEVHGLWQVLGGRCTVYGGQQAETDTAVFYTVSIQYNYPFFIF